MLRTIPASQAKYNFGEVIRRVYEKGEVQIIERAGMPVVGIVSMSDIERLYPKGVRETPHLMVSAKRERAVRRLFQIMDDMQVGNEKYNEDEVEADVQAAVNEVRYGKNIK